MAAAFISSLDGDLSWTRSRVDDAAVQLALQDLASHAQKEGLLPDEIAEIVTRIAGDAQLAKDDRLFSLAVKCMLPSSSVPQEAAVQMLGAFGSLSLQTKQTVLSWMVLVFEHLDSLNELHALYPVFFHYLDYDTLRPLLCNLIHRLTRRSDVRPFRISRLCTLFERSGWVEPALYGLLLQYQELFPSNVVIPQPRTKLRAPFFKPPDPAWAEAIAAVQQPANQLQNAVSAGVPERRNKRKRSRPVRIPDLATSTLLGGSTVCSTMAEVKRLPDLASKLKTLRMPNQLASVLNSTLMQCCVDVPVLTAITMQHVLVLKPGAGDWVRVEHWLRYRLAELFHWLSPSPKQRKLQIELLEHVLALVQFFQQVPKVITHFLFETLEAWDGFSHRKPILQIISSLPPMPFPVLFKGVLHPVHEHVIARSTDFKVQVLEAYTSLLQRIEWEEPRADGDQLAGFQKWESGMDCRRAIRDFVLYVDELSSIVIELTDSSLHIVHAVLSFYEVVCGLKSEFGLPFTIPPSPAIIYSCMLSNCSLAISRVCGLFVKYKAEFEQLKDLKNSPQLLAQPLSFGDGTEKIPMFNNYVMDFSNVLWRQRAFEEQSKTILFKVDPNLLAAISVPGLKAHLSLTHSGAFSSLCWSYLRKLQQRKFPDQQLVLRPEMVKDKFRIDYLDYLKSHGLHGVHEFLYTFIGSLVSRSQKPNE